MPITGRVVDLEGRPVAGSTVQVTQITKPKAGDLDAWLEAVKRGEPPWTAYSHLNAEPPIKPEEERLTATTDAQGRFRIDGLGAEQIVSLKVQGPTIAHTSLRVVTRRMEPVPAKGFPTNYGSEGESVLGADFTCTAAPGRPVEGVIRDVKTGEPLAGVGVRSEHFAGAVMHGIRDLKTTTDAQGRFRLVGFPKGRDNQVLIVPNDDQPYFLKNYQVPDPPGLAPVSVDVGMDRGIWIEGKVTDQETGKPVAGAWLHYLPFLENKFAQRTSVFHGGGNTDGVTYQDRYKTRADGTYRLVGLPGRAIVGAVSHADKPYLQGAGSESIKGMNQHGDFPTYRNPVDPSKLWPTSMKEINPPEGSQAIHLDLEFVPGTKVRVRVVDPQGQPVTDLKLGGRTQRGRHEWNAKHGAEFDVVTLAPAEDRMVLVVQEERKLGKIFHVKPGDDKDGPVTVRLEPLATIAGRVLDADGNAVSGATIRTDPQPGGNFSMSLAGWITSDRSGKFVVPQVPTGCPYALVVESGLGPRDHRVAFAQDLSVRAGETTAVGDIRFKND
jgi:protocatechuate 3,4-dioxygenase beta subunit